jgi:uncharacterized protein YjbI with pentapeptide repeats
MNYLSLETIQRLEHYRAYNLRRGYPPFLNAYITTRSEIEWIILTSQWTTDKRRIQLGWRGIRARDGICYAPVNFAGAIFHGIDFQDWHVWYGNFQHTVWVECSCQGSIFARCTFHGALIVSCHFEKADITLSQFPRAVIHDSQFCSAVGKKCDFSHVSFSCSSFAETELFGSSFTQASFNMMDFSSAGLYSTRWEATDVEETTFFQARYSVSRDRESLGLMDQHQYYNPEIFERAFL